MEFAELLLLLATELTVGFFIFKATVEAPKGDPQRLLCTEKGCMWVSNVVLGETLHSKPVNLKSWGGPFWGL